MTAATTKAPATAASRAVGEPHTSPLQVPVQTPGEDPPPLVSSKGMGKSIPYAFHKAQSPCGFAEQEREREANHHFLSHGRHSGAATVRAV